MIEPIEAEERRAGEARARTETATAAAGVAASDQGVTVVTRPEAGERKVVEAASSQRVRFEFSLTEVQVGIVDVDVILRFPNGGQIVMPSFMLGILALEPPRIAFNSLEVDPQSLLTTAGDIRLVDQLPQLTVSENIRPEAQAPPAPTQAPGVQVTANQSFANTPTPVVRAIPSLDSSNVEQVQQFARQQRTRQEEGDGLGARNGGALTERSDRTANAIQQDRDRPDAARDQAAPDKRDEADAISANAPEIISDGGGPTASLFQAENLSIVTLVRATDPDPDSVLSYAIVGGADASLFSINSANGTLYFVSPPDFEGQQSAANNATYDVVVEVSDGFRTDRQALTVTVGDINERPTGATLSNGTVVENSAGGTVVGNVVGVDQDAGDSLTYSFAPNGDAGGRFAIDAVTGSITVVNGAVLNHEASNQQLVIVRVTDQNGLFLDRALVIAVTDANDAPVITSNGGGATATITLAENAVSVATVTASDEDAGSSVSYAIVGGADAAQFTINATTGALSFIGPRDFENPADIGGDNRYEVVVQASDGLGGVDTQALTVDISNINDAPQNVTLSSNTVAENSANGVLVGTVSAVDPDAGATLTYSFAPGGDAAGRFQIDPVTGALTVADGTRLDYEANASHLIIVRVTDDQGLSVDTPFSITVTNVNEAPDITAFGGGPTALVVQAENTAALGVITAVDPEGAPLTYSIAGGADAARFTINATTGALSFTVPPDFENPADSDGDNHYHVVIEVSDGALSVQQALDIAVVDTGEAPVIISNGAGPNAAISINEGQQAVTTVLATDEDAGSALTYSIFGGLDAARFTIDATTGVLTLAAPPDFENPTDSNANNVYQVIVQASDGVLVDRQTIDVTVLNINDPPVITSDGGGATAFVSVAENSLTVTTVTAVDPDIGAALIYTITGGADSAKFTINSATGELRFIAPVSFEAPEDAGADNIYNVQVQALDGLGGVDTQDIAVQVTNQNEAPIITSNGGGATASVSIAENGAAVTTVAATDPDAGATLTYSISGGLDAARFVINAATGVLQFVSAPDFDAPADAGGDNVYNVNVQVSDGLGGVDVQAIAVTVTNLNEAPVITSNGAGATASIMFAENGGAVTTVTAADPDAGASITYTIIGGADAARFTLNPTTGVLAFVTPPDFEAPTDAGGDNTYDLIVQASDGLGGLDTQAIAVTVTNANEPPVITSNGGGDRRHRPRRERDRRHDRHGERCRCRERADLLDRRRGGLRPVYDQRDDGRALLRQRAELRGPGRRRGPTTSTTCACRSPTVSAASTRRTSPSRSRTSTRLRSSPRTAAGPRRRSASRRTAERSPPSPPPTPTPAQRLPSP